MDKKSVAWEATTWLIYAIIILVVLIGLVYVLYTYGDQIWSKVASLFP